MYGAACCRAQCAIEAVVQVSNTIVCERAIAMWMGDKEVCSTCNIAKYIVRLFLCEVKWESSDWLMSYICSQT